MSKERTAEQTVFDNVVGILDFLSTVEIFGSKVPEGFADGQDFDRIVEVHRNISTDNGAWESVQAELLKMVGEKLAQARDCKEALVIHRTIVNSRISGEFAELTATKVAELIKDTSEARLVCNKITIGTKLWNLARKRPLELGEQELKDARTHNQLNRVLRNVPKNSDLRQRVAEKLRRHMGIDE